MATTIERLLLPIIECPPFLPPSYQEGGEEREIAEEERRYAKYVNAILQSKEVGNSTGTNEYDAYGMEYEGDDDDDGMARNEGSPQKKKARSVNDIMLKRKRMMAEAQVKEDLVACFQEELGAPRPRKSLNGNIGGDSLDKSINNVSMADDISMDVLQ